jgi:hypothetical protein
MRLAEIEQQADAEASHLWRRSQPSPETISVSAGLWLVL